jgi:lipopolysaccharide transport system ATP-binding protein
MRGVCFVPGNFFNDETYQITIRFVQDSLTVLYIFENCISFTIHDSEREGNWYGKWFGIGIVRLKLKWDMTAIKYNE